MSVSDILVSERHSPEGDKVLKIFRISVAGHEVDPDKLNPRRGDDLDIHPCFSTLYCKDESMGDLHSACEAGDTHSDRMKAIEKVSVVKVPIYACVGCDPVINTHPFAKVADGGLVGYAYVKQENLDQWHTNDLVEINYEIMHEVSEHNLFLSGEIYQFKLFDKTLDEQGKVSLEEIFGNWPFFGDSGILTIYSQLKAQDWAETINIDMIPSVKAQNQSAELGV